MTSQEKAENEFPELNHMLGCYFNQDYEDFYGDLLNALAVYCRETSASHRISAAKEIDRLLKDPARVNPILNELGSANIRVSNAAVWMQTVATRIRESRPGDKP